MQLEIFLQEEEQEEIALLQLTVTVTSDCGNGLSEKAKTAVDFS